MTAEPFMTAGQVEVTGQFRQSQGELSDGLGTIDCDEATAGGTPKCPNDFGHRQTDSVMADVRKHQTGASLGEEAIHHGFDELSGRDFATKNPGTNAEVFDLAFHLACCSLKNVGVARPGKVGDEDGPAVAKQLVCREFGKVRGPARQ